MKDRLLCTFLLIATGTPLSAGNKVYVATFGNDGNPCNTFSQPCATWAGAIFRAGASGVVLALDSGDFGFIDISQPIVIDGGAHGAFATGSGQLVFVSLGQSAGGPVILRNISVVIDPFLGGSDTGILASLSGGSLVLDHVTVTLGANSQTHGISIGAAAGLPVDLKDVTVSGVSSGIEIFNITSNPTTTVNAVLQNVSVSASQSGLHTIDAAVTIRNSSFRGALTGIGSFTTSTSPVWTLDSTQVTNNGTGISVNGGTLRLFNNVISGNVIGINNTGGTVISFRNNAFSGNGTDGSSPLATSLK